MVPVSPTAACIPISLGLSARLPRWNWAREIRRRLLSDAWLKLTGISLFVAAFFAAYFFVLQHPMFAVTVMPLTPVDAWVPFQPEAFWLYVSLWIYSPLAAGLSGDRRELLRHSLAAGALAVAGLALFFCWPSAIPLSDIDWSLHPWLEPLKQADAAGNACPSLHVAFAVLGMIAIERVCVRIGAPTLVRALNLVWCVGIIYSTLAIRQHVVIDAIAGCALGAGAGLFLRGAKGEA